MSSTQLSSAMHFTLFLALIFLSYFCLSNFFSPVLTLSSASLTAPRMTSPLCVSQFQQCPSSPGNSGAFSRTFHPGGRALGLISLPSNYPGAFDHPTFFHLTTLSFLLMTISSANTVSFFLNTSR